MLTKNQSIISKEVASDIKKGSWIRQMFEAGSSLKQKVGVDNVLDFSLGNPVLDPPESFYDGLAKLIAKPSPGMHRYMSNAGFTETREVVANHLTEINSLNFDRNDIVMTVGAGGALNVILKSILNPLDKVMILSPFFAEYIYYIKNQNAVPQIVETNRDFSPDLEKIEQNLNFDTKAILINTPNNPTGVVYSQEIINGITDILKKAETKFQHKIYLISDEPYSNILFDNHTQGSIFKSYTNSIVATSHSKDFSLAGERIGYIAVNPMLEGKNDLVGAFIFCNRTLGFVNAPALMQRILHYIYQNKDATYAANNKIYSELRSLICDILSESGYKFQKPGGSFYIFPETPIPNDLEFTDLALKHNVVIVPGTGYGRSGHFRISFATSREIIEKSRSKFKILFDEAKNLSS